MIALNKPIFLKNKIFFYLKNKFKYNFTFSKISSVKYYNKYYFSKKYKDLFYFLT